MGSGSHALEVFFLDVEVREHFLNIVEILEIFQEADDLLDLLSLHLQHVLWQPGQRCLGEGDLVVVKRLFYLVEPGDRGDHLEDSFGIVEILGTGTTPRNGKKQIGLAGSLTIKASDFGVNSWEDFETILGDEVEIEIVVEANAS